MSGSKESQQQILDAAVIEHIVEMLSYGQLSIADFKPPDQFSPYEVVMEALADMMDRALQPEDGAPGVGAGSQAGKALSRQISAAARAQLAQIKRAKELKEKLPNGAPHDNK